MGFSRFAWPYARSDVRQFLYTAKRIRAGTDMVLIGISFCGDPWDVGTRARQPGQCTTLRTAAADVMAVAACRTRKSWEEHRRSRMAFGEWTVHSGREECRSDVSSPLDADSSRPKCDHSCLSRARHHAWEHTREPTLNLQ